MADLAIKSKIKSALKRIVQRLERTSLISSIVRTQKALDRLPDVIAATDRLSHHDNFLQSVPVTLRGIARDNTALQTQLQDLKVQLESTQKQYWETQTRLDAVQHQLWDTQAQFKGVVDGYIYLPQRIEFVRTELMFEMRYGSTAAIQGTKPEKIAIDILSPDKLSLQRFQGIRLNLGCGHIALEGYLNVDTRALPGVDIVADVASIPFGESEVSEIFSSHVLEHFPQEQLRRQLLPYWAKLLKPGGAFVAIVPDADAMIQDYVKGDYLYSHLREVFFGSQDYDGDFHFNMFVPEQLKDLFLEAGLSNFQVTVRGRKNGACLEMEVRGYKE
jgi:SAM-dependent methyltransferase